MKKRRKKNIERLKRLNFNEEQSLPWLSILLDAYSIIDEGVKIAVKRETKNKNATLACHMGCDFCCHTHTDIPVYPLELTGIEWYVTEKISENDREILKINLNDKSDGSPCPFIINNMCSIHQLRPISCRQFNVLNMACKPGEDPFFTRREDVVNPIRDYTLKAFRIMLPFYGVTDDLLMTDYMADYIIHTEAINLMSVDWGKLARRI